MSGYYRMYQKMYKAKCQIQKKENIYQSPNFTLLPVSKPPLPPTMPIYQPLDQCGHPYSVPMYHPPYCGCGCKTK